MGVLSKFFNISYVRLRFLALRMIKNITNDQHTDLMLFTFDSIGI